MFIIVRYGANKQQVFNPECITASLLINIKERCECQDDDIVDLSDDDGGMKKLNDHRHEYGSSLFKNREILILVKQHKFPGQDGGEDKLYLPTLYSLEDDENFIRRLNSSSHRKGPRKSVFSVNSTPRQSEKGRRISIAKSSNSEKTTPRKSKPRSSITN